MTGRPGGSGRAGPPSPLGAAPLSLAGRLAALDPADRQALWQSVAQASGREGLARLAGDWRLWARPSQLPPPGTWRVWLVMAGRGFGKTRAGAEWVRALAEGAGSQGAGAVGAGAASAGSTRIALVGATLAEARAVMVEGESGLLSICPGGNRPVWEPSLRRLTWPGGAMAFLYSADEPEQLRGPQHHFAWCDELGKWRQAQAAWANLELGLRLGTHPRAAVTTTPRPVPLLRQLLERADTAVSRGATWENRAHLAPGFLNAMAQLYGGTRLGRQELEGELLEAIEGALWSYAMIDGLRAAQPLPDFVRVVVAVDPPVTGGPDADACGIIAAGLGSDGTAYVLADCSVQGASPEGWARAVEACAAEFGADRVVAEANNGGELVGLVLRSVNARLPVKLVRASRGKAARAEPVAALYEQGRVRHAGNFPQLEDEMCALLPGGAYVGATRSPDRADALVWALTELMLGPEAREPRVRRI